MDGECDRERDTGARRWYAVHTLSGRESQAEANLGRQGYAPFVPRQRRTVRHARKLWQKVLPFFPGYIFVPLDLSVDRWRPINGTFGVRSLVMRGDRPAMCPAGLVEHLISVTDGDGVLDLTSQLEEGAPVRIVAGPFADLVGTLERLDAAGRARILLAMVSGEIAVRMDVRSLEAA